MTETPTYVLERQFAAPRDLVWRTLTEAELLARWYGPNVETVIHKLDVRAGGVWLNEMKMGERSNRERMEYTEVSPPERLVWLHSMADENWDIAANPMMADWPRVLLTTITLTEEAGKTTLRLTWTPHEASDAEKACFAGAMEGLDRGWGAGMDLLEQILAELQA